MSALARVFQLWSARAFYFMTKKAKTRSLLTTIKAAGDYELDVLANPYGWDRHGERFLPTTQFHEDKIPFPPVIYYHGMDDNGKPTGDPQFIGRTVRRWVDKAGVWYHVILDKTSELAKKIWGAAQNGTVRASSGVVPAIWRVDEQGNILTWLNGELSLFDISDGKQPANNYAVALPSMKALYQQAGIELPDSFDEIKEGEAEQESRKPKRFKSTTKPTKYKLEKSMTYDIFEVNGQYFVYAVDAQGEAQGDPLSEGFASPEEAKAKLATLQGGKVEPPAAPAPAKPNRIESMKAVSDLTQKVDALSADVKKILNAPPIKSGGFATPRDPNKIFKSIGEQLLAVKSVATNGANAITDFNKLKAVQGASEGSGSDAGFLLQQEFSTETLDRVYSTGQVLSAVNKRTLGANANGITVNTINETSRADGSRFGGVRAYWLNEGGSMTKSKPSYRRFNLPLEKVIGLYYATDELLADVTALGGEVSDMFSKEINFVCEDAIFNGTGAGMPLGILNAGVTVSVSKETGQAAATVVYQNLIKMWARMWAPSRAKANWYVSQDIEPQLDQLSLAAGTGALEPRFVTYGADGVMRIKGRPVIPVEYTAALGTVGDIVLADPTGYRWIDKGGIESASSIHVYFDTDQMAFRWTYRANGAPFWASALTPKNASSTLSQFVTLATRS